MRHLAAPNGTSGLIHIQAGLNKRTQGRRLGSEKCNKGCAGSKKNDMLDTGVLTVAFLPYIPLTGLPAGWSSLRTLAEES